MAENKKSGISGAVKGFNSLSLVRQVALMLGLSVSVAVGVAVVMWVQEPNYRPLMSQLDAKTTTQVVDALQQAGIQYKINSRDGTVMVPDKQVYQARMKLASSGISTEATGGFADLDKNSNLGTSRFMENVRYRRALELELSRTISGIKGISSARVHLAMPRETSFISNQAKARASVFVSLSRPSLDKEQVSAIVQMVASSITGLDPREVSITDQYGRLLSSPSSDALSVSKEQFNYQKSMQSYYEKRIESMIAPMLGLNKVKVRVFADIDFTHQESTKEKYSPDDKTVVSEQSIKEQNNAAIAGGAAGAAANQPGAAGATKKNTGSSRDQTIKNYEVGKSISYVKNQPGKLKNLSIAVVVDNETKVNAKTGKVTIVPITKEKLDKITSLVKTAMGFDAKRGDKVSVVNAAFVAPPKVEALAPLPLWKQAWFIDVAKKGAGVLLALLLALFLIKPLLGKLVAKNESAGELALAEPGTEEALSPEMAALKQQQMDSLKQMASQDPSKIAKVLRNWVGTE